jgi:hypothetical protein
MLDNKVNTNCIPPCRSANVIIRDRNTGFFVPNISINICCFVTQVDEIRNFCFTGRIAIPLGQKNNGFKKGVHVQHHQLLLNITLADVIRMMKLR